MSDYSDIVDRVLDYAGKTGEAPENIVKGTLDGVIDEINTELDSYTVANRKNDIPVAASAKTVTMPSGCQRIIELGLYDSSTDRIKIPYTEITESEFHARFRGTVTLSPISADGINEWFLLDDTAGKARKIRLVYPPSGSFTMMVRFFEHLTSTNVDRLEQQDILYQGCVSRLAKWFKDDHVKAGRLYLRGLNTLKGARRSLRRTISRQVHPQIAQHNATAAGLVE
jgi:hypothetical protein